MSELFIPILLSSSGTIALSGLILFLFKNLIINRLTKGVQHEYDQKLENLKYELRKQENEISDVRKAAISNAMISQNSIDQKRLQALENLWDGFIDIKKNIMAPNILATIKAEEIAKDIKNPKIKDFIEAITKTINLDDPKKIFHDSSIKVQKSRPWIGRKIWAIYTAYSSLISYSVLVLISLKTLNEDPLKLLDRAKTVDTVKKALPDLNIDWDNLNDAIIPHLLELLETVLLNEIDLVISGEASDLEANKRAVKISQQLESLNIQANETSQKAAA